MHRPTKEIISNYSSDTPGNYTGELEEFAHTTDHLIDEAGFDSLRGQDELIPFINQFSYPIFITEEYDDTIMVANSAASEQSGGRSLAEKPLRHLIWAQESVDTHTTLGYFGRKWQIMYKEEIVWNGKTCQKISLQEHPDLPEMELIESTRDMIAVMLHRFRSPMTGMQGYLDLLLGESETDRDKKRITTLNHGMEQLNNMLDELERLYHSNTDAPPEPLHLQAIAQEVVSSLDDETKNRVHIRQTGYEKMVQINRKKIGKLLKILLTNAAEHTSGNTKPIYIDLESSRKITVTNFGEPIPEFVNDRMFLPFMTNKAQNMGIGLTQAHILARYIGASIIPTGNSREKGISFTILLPPSLY